MLLAAALAAAETCAGHRSAQSPGPLRRVDNACLQAAKTYLERKFEGFESSSLDELIRHALQALAASITDGELTASSCTVVSMPCPGMLKTFRRHLGGLRRLE